jgi:hypothetical protein
MGMLRDKKNRNNLGRKDDVQRRRMVADTRNAIYQGQYAVDWERVNKVLMEQSLAPIAVGTSFNLDEAWLIMLSRMLSLQGCLMLILTYFRCLPSTSCMSLNRVFGRRFSSICFACLNLKGAHASTSLIGGTFFITSYWHSLIIAERFRQIPTFGRGTIWKFSSNASVMKRFTAHDFEDLLQVGASLRQTFLRQLSLCSVLSVQYQCSMVYSMVRITTKFFNFFSCVPTGMGLQSSVCILMRRWHYWMKPPFFLELDSDIL